MENYDLGSKSGLKYLLKTAIKESWTRNEDLKYFPKLHAWKRKRNEEINAVADEYFGKKTGSKTIVQESEDIDYLANPAPLASQNEEQPSSWKFLLNQDA